MDFGKSTSSILNQKNQNENNSFIIPQKLTRPDKLIVAAKESLKERNYHYNGLKDTARGILKIKVSPKNVNRAIRFMDTLIKIFRLKGHSIIVGSDNTSIVVHEEHFQISLREKLKRTEVPSKYSWKQYDWSPTGILVFSVRYSYPLIEWCDGKIPLENRLAEIIETIELKALEHKKERLEIEAFWAEEKRQENIKKEIEQRKQKEQSEFNALLNESEKWQKVKTLRNYIDAIEARATENDKLSNDLKMWVAWARQKADNFDPLLNFLSNQPPDSIL